MLCLNNPASSKIMIGLLNHLSSATWATTNVCPNDDRIQNQKENKNNV